MTGPTIAVFVCKAARTALAGPDGTETVPPGVQVIEVPCSGRADEVMVLRALRKGASAAVIVACLDGNCKNRTGTYQVRRRVEETRSLLQQLGMDPNRVRMFSVASNQHAKLMKDLEEMVDLTQRLGTIRILEGDR
jgi:coenzyme F420-reducing hydrogenase delta subunit